MSDDERDEADEEAIRRRREALIAQQGPVATPRPPDAMPQTCLSIATPQPCLSPVRPQDVPQMPEAPQKSSRLSASFVIAVVVNVLAAVACVVWWLVR